MPTTWTEVTVGSTTWSESALSPTEWHPRGSPIGLLLALTYQAVGDGTWVEENDPSTVWTLAS